MTNDPTVWRIIKEAEHAASTKPTDKRQEAKIKYLVWALEAMAAHGETPDEWVAREYSN